MGSFSLLLLLTLLLFISLLGMIAAAASKLQNCTSFDQDLPKVGAWQDCLGCVFLAAAPTLNPTRIQLLNIGLPDSHESILMIFNVMMIT